jgi:hypothetical protein
MKFDLVRVIVLVINLSAFVVPTYFWLVATTCRARPFSITMVLLPLLGGYFLLVVTRQLVRDLVFYSAQKSLFEDSGNPTLVPYPGVRSGLMRLFFLHPFVLFMASWALVPLSEFLFCQMHFVR